MTPLVWVMTQFFKGSWRLQVYVGLVRGLLLRQNGGGGGDTVSLRFLFEVNLTRVASEKNEPPISGLSWKTLQVMPGTRRHGGVTPFLDAWTPLCDTVFLPMRLGPQRKMAIQLSRWLLKVNPNWAVRFRLPCYECLTSRGSNGLTS